MWPFTQSQPHKPLTEKERQTEHFRKLQWWTFYLTDLYFGLSLAGIFALIYFLPPDKYEKVRDIVALILGVVLREWAGTRGYVFGTSAGSARNAEALRSLASNTQPTNEKVGE
jgi:hypothetical protein